jgi:hypothetical protein
VIPERRERFKEVDEEAARRNASLPLFDSGDRKTITIDTSGLTAEATVERILQALPKVDGRDKATLRPIP